MRDEGWEQPRARGGEVRCFRVLLAPDPPGEARRADGRPGRRRGGGGLAGGGRGAAGHPAGSTGPARPLSGRKERGGGMAARAAVEEVPVWLEVSGAPLVTWMCPPDRPLLDGG